ncbi:MAG: pyrroline-5-carboxylate reductase, partial [Alphaproteobacteria bacterium]|nr:pyrroline-5-carboxylate reductase [Alphaproteobacteria bacterium]
MSDMSGLSGPVLLVGCGKMGGALLGGWLDQGIAADQVVVVEPALDAERSAVPDGVAVLADADGIAADLAPAVVIFAVKPQVMGDVVPSYSRFVAAGAVFLSIAAGTPISFFEANLGDGAAVVRVMPNTPAAVRRGMSVLCANAHASAAQRELCGGLMAAVGDTAWLDDEGLMDAVTAVSGSGPAYVFHLIECLAQAGVEVGLDAELSARLALQTVAGSGELARTSDDDAAQLRVNVTSPGGT